MLTEYCFGHCKYPNGVMEEKILEVFRDHQNHIMVRSVMKCITCGTCWSIVYGVTEPKDVKEIEEVS